MIVLSDLPKFVYGNFPSHPWCVYTCVRVLKHVGFFSADIVHTQVIGLDRQRAVMQAPCGHNFQMVGRVCISLLSVGLVSACETLSHHACNA